MKSIPETSKSDPAPFLVLVVTVGVGVADRPAEAPQEGPWDKQLHIFNNPTFGQAMGAIGQQVLSVGATPAL
jgi:hypothetical protein